MSPGKEQGPSPLGPDRPRPTLLCTRVSGCQCCWASSVGSRGRHPRGTPTLARCNLGSAEQLSGQTAPPSGRANVSTTAGGHTAAWGGGSPTSGRGPVPQAIPTLPFSPSGGCHSSGLLSPLLSKAGSCLLHHVPSRSPLSQSGLSTALL